MRKMLTQNIMCLFSSKFILQIRIIKFTTVFLSSWKEKIKTWNDWKQYKIIYFSAVTQSCLTPCYPMDCSMPGFPVHHQLLELAQTHVHRVRGAIQPSHPLLSPSPPAFSLSQHQDFFQILDITVCMCESETSKVFSFILYIFFKISFMKIENKRCYCMKSSKKNTV